MRRLPGFKKSLAVAAAFAGLALLVPPRLVAWGANAQRLVANKAVDTLPPDLRPFFDLNRNFIMRHATDSVALLEKSPKIERRTY